MDRIEEVKEKLRFYRDLQERRPDNDYTPELAFEINQLYEPQQQVCPVCKGKKQVLNIWDNTQDCILCNATGKVEPRPDQSSRLLTDEIDWTEPTRRMMKIELTAGQIKASQIR